MSINMRTLFLFLMISINALALTSDELAKLERKLGDGPLIPDDFIQECYRMIAKEENARHLKYLSILLDKAQSTDKDEVLKLLKSYEIILKTEN